MSTDAHGASIRRAAREDAGAIAELLRSCAGDCIPEPEDWVREHAHRFHLAVDPSGGVAATAALLPAGRDTEVLRSVAVRRDRRGSGLAARLLDPLLAGAGRRGVSIWCRTSRPGFFQRLAFRIAQRDRDDDRCRMVRTPEAASSPATVPEPVPSSTPESRPNPKENSMSTTPLVSEHTMPITDTSEDVSRPRKRRVAIVPARRRDMAIAADIIRSTASWYRPILDPADMGEHEVGTRWIAENYDRREFYLGWRGERPVGVLSIQEAGDALYLGYVYLYEDQVGNGYGRELLEFARDQAAVRSKRSMVLIAHPEADWATKAYRRFGFRKVARSRDEVLRWNDGWIEPYYEEGFQLYEYRL